MRYLIGIAALGFLLALFSHAAPPPRPDEARPARVALADSHASMRASGSANAEAIRDEYGRFHLDVTVNGASASFLVDTGADTVVLTADTARTFGIFFDPNMSEPVMQTANGVGTGHRVTIPRLTVGGRTVENIPAIVADNIDINLLGQSVISQLGAMHVDGDRMTFGA